MPFPSSVVWHLAYNPQGRPFVTFSGAHLSSLKISPWLTLCVTVNSKCSITSKIPKDRRVFRLWIKKIWYSFVLNFSLGQKSINLTGLIKCLSVVIRFYMTFPPTFMHGACGLWIYNSDHSPFYLVSSLLCSFSIWVIFHLGEFFVLWVRELRNNEFILIL